MQSSIEANVAVERRDPAMARRVLEEALRRFPRDGILLQTWSRILFEHDNPVLAEPHLRTLIDLDAEDAPAWHNLGTVLMLKRHFSEAADAFGQSLRYRPDSVMTRMSRAEALVALGRVGEARRELEAARRTAPGDAGVQAAWERLLDR